MKVKLTDYEEAKALLKRSAEKVDHARLVVDVWERALALNKSRNGDTLYETIEQDDGAILLRTETIHVERP